MYEDIPIDYTGRGPTGTGYRPTRAALNRQAENRFRTDRNAEAMMYVDPSINAAVEMAARVTAGSNDPAKVREAAYNGPGGQAVRDAAMIARRNGYMGYGDPVNYSHNITRGVTGGGFTADIVGKDNNGRDVSGMNQRVSGNGLLSERVTKSFQKGFIRDLYGDGAADPNKLSGFDMEEASGVAATIMRRGGIGKAATLVRNADTQTRLDAATASMHEGPLKDKMSKIQAGSNEELDKIIAATNDPKLKKTLEGVKGSTDAIVVNGEAHKKIAGVVKEVTKGMAALGDMYGELSAPELHAKLESITGQKIVSKSQAKAATAMVNDMRNSAESIGMDPRAYFEMAQQNQLSTRERLGQATGIDERNGTALTGLHAKVSAAALDTATKGAKNSQQVAADAKELGWDLDSTVKSPDEILKDQNDNMMKYQEANRGEAMIRGGIALNKFTTPAAKAKAAELIAAKENAKDANEREAAEAQLKNFAGENWGGESKSFYAAEESRQGDLLIAAQDKDGGMTRQVNKVYATVNDSQMRNVMRDNMGVGAADANGLADSFSNKLGAKGLLAIAKDSKADKDGTGKIITPEERKKRIRDRMIDANMSADEQAKAESVLLDDNGNMKDPAAMKALTDAVATQAWDGGAGTEYVKTETKRDAFNNIGKDSVRKKVAGADGKGLILPGIVNAIVNGSMKGVTDAETSALMLGAFKNEQGVTSMMVDERDADGNVIYDPNSKTKKAKQFDLMKEYQVGIDLSDGFSKEAMAKLKEANGGKDLGLAEKMGYASEAELAEKTKGADKGGAAQEEFMKAYGLLTKDDAYSGLNIAGDVKNTTAISDRALEASKDSKTGLDVKAKAMAATRMLFPNLKENESNVFLTDLMKNDQSGATANLAAQFKADKAEGSVKSEGYFWNPGSTSGKLKNNRKLVSMAERGINADEAETQSLAAADPNGEISKQFQEQIKALRFMQGQGADTIISEDGSKNNVQESIDKLQAYVDKMAQATIEAKGGQTVPEMHVTNLHVTNIPDNKKL